LKLLEAENDILYVPPTADDRVLKVNTQGLCPSQALNTLNCSKKEVRFMLMRTLTFCLYAATIFVIAACSKPPAQIAELKRFPVDNMQGVITQSGVQMDKEVSSDGNGSLRISAKEPITVRLFEVGDIDVENARLIYQAKVRTEGVEGQVFLEMGCHFPDKGEFFSRGLQTPLTGTTEWTTEETPFFLKKGENPDNVKLNLVVNGRGTAWIDDIRLLKGPLQ
jgi:hypothetical protein